MSNSNSASHRSEDHLLQRLESVETWDELATCLMDLKKQTGRSYGEIAAYSSRGRFPIAKSTAENLAKGRVAPRLESLQGFLHGNGLMRIDAWLVVWTRLNDTTPTRFKQKNETSSRKSRTVAAWDPYALGVHKASTPSRESFISSNDLPPYLIRHHDFQIRDILKGLSRSALIVITGDAATGKSRTALEAVRDCLPDWPLLYPLIAEELLSMLKAGLRDKSILWLDELAGYLRGDSEGALVATNLRRLLAGPQTIVTIGSLWTNDWDRFTATSPEIYEMHGQLLKIAYRVFVPNSFTLEEMRDGEQLISSDSRLRAAADGTGRSGQLIEVLSGGPDLIARYEMASAEDRYSQAVLMAAMDAFRLGHFAPIPGSYLEQAAAGYMNSQERVSSRAQTFQKALSYATLEVKGVSALTAIRLAYEIGQADSYQLHDYLKQYGLTTRSYEPIPASTWEALTTHVIDPGSLVAIANEASRRLLYRQAVRLAGKAAISGNSAAMWLVADLLDQAGYEQLARHWRLRAAQTGDPMIMLLQEANLRRGGNHVAADSMLEEAAGTRFPLAMWKWGERLDELQRHEESESWRLDAADTSDPIVMWAWAVHLVQVGRVDEARPWIERSARAGIPAAIRTKIDDLERSGKKEQALAWMIRAANADDIWVAWELAKQLDSSGNHTEAEVWRRRIIEPRDRLKSLALMELADGLDNLDREEEAHDLRRRAAEAGDQFAVIALLSETIDNDDDIELDDDVVRDLIAVAHKEPLAALAVAALLEEADRDEEANEVRERAAATGNPVLLAMAAYEDDLPKGYKTENLLRRAIEVGDTMSAAPLQTLLQQTGREEEARHLYNFGLEPGGRTAVPWKEAEIGLLKDDDLG